MLGEYHGKVTWGNTKLLPRPPLLAADKYWSSRNVILSLQFAVIWFFSAIWGLIAHWHSVAPCQLGLSQLTFFPRLAAVLSNSCHCSANEHRTTFSAEGFRLCNYSSVEGFTQRIRHTYYKIHMS